MRPTREREVYSRRTTVLRVSLSSKCNALGHIDERPAVRDAPREVSNVTGLVAAGEAQAIVAIVDRSRSEAMSLEYLRTDWCELRGYPWSSSRKRN